MFIFYDGSSQREQCEQTLKTVLIATDEYIMEGLMAAATAG